MGDHIFPRWGFTIILLSWGTTGVYLYLEGVRVAARATEDFMEAGEVTEAEENRGDVE